MPKVKGYTVACRSPKCGPKETCEVYYGRKCKYKRQNGDDAIDLG